MTMPYTFSARKRIRFGLTYILVQSSYLLLHKIAFLTNALTILLHGLFAFEQDVSLIPTGQNSFHTPPTSLLNNLFDFTPVIFAKQKAPYKTERKHITRKTQSCCVNSIWLYIFVRLRTALGRFSVSIEILLRLHG